MRVLLVVEQLRRRVPGGIATYARGLCRGLLEMAEGGEETPEVELLAAMTAERPDPVDALGFPKRLSRLPDRLLIRAWEHGLITGPRGFDLLHSTSMAIPPSRGPHRPVSVLTVHDLAWRRFPHAYNARGTAFHERALVRLIRHADHVVVPSPPVADDLVEAGLGEDRVSVIAEGSDHLVAPDLDRAGLLLRSLGILGDVPYLLSVGTLEPRKNLGRLFSAYELYRRQVREPWPLVVVGPKGWGPRLSPPPGAVLAGRVDEPVLAALYRAAGAVAYVPLYEGFGLPPLEAMASGTPVLASPMPSADGFALVVDPTDVGSIAGGIVQLVSDEALRRELVELGHERAACLTWAAAARHHAELWRSLG